jgi:hypothetical protein
LHYESGEEVGEEGWKTIRRSARGVVNKKLHSLRIPTRLPANTSRTKSFYSEHYPRQWEEALRILEELHPVLALCADSWKAEQTLQKVLSTSKKKNINTNSDEELTDSPAHTNATPKPKSKRNHAFGTKKRHRSDSDPPKDVPPAPPKRSKHPLSTSGQNSGVENEEFLSPPGTNGECGAVDTTPDTMLNPLQESKSIILPLNMSMH